MARSRRHRERFAAHGLPEHLRWPTFNETIQEALDLKERLHAFALGEGDMGPRQLCAEAANCIEMLRAHLEGTPPGGVVVASPRPGVEA